jgi:transcriptional regulator with XRE-family HTH domain
MNVRYSPVNWEFDTAAFSAAVTEALSFATEKELAEMLGVHHSTVNNWARGKFTGEFRWPHMYNFLSICNLLDLDPRSFFVLTDKE